MSQNGDSSDQPRNELEQELRLQPPKNIEQEIQAKFTSERFATSSADEILALVIGTLPLGQYTYQDKKKVIIKDIYLDDFHLSIYKRNWSLRVRRIGSEVELTLKTPVSVSGSEMDRLETHIRFHDEAAFEEAENKGFAHERAVLNLDCDSLFPVLAVENNRVSCVMNCKEERYQLSIDSFTHTYIKTGSVSGPNVEIEIEAKSPSARSELPILRATIKRRLASANVITDSKYVRGIRNLGLVSELVSQDGQQLREVEIASPTQSKRTQSSRIFIVHGHDAALKYEIARLIEKLGMTPVILHEQVDRGRTIFTKLRDELADVEYAFVLLTPDDVGAAHTASANLNKRARQNVVFELGLLIGMLGAERVCAILKEGVEIPSDLQGVIYKYISHSQGINAIALDLVKELRSAGYDVNANLL